MQIKPNLGKEDKHSPGDLNSRIETEEPVAGDMVGAKIREIRTRYHLSLRKLAERSGLNVNTLSLVENGKSSPSVSTLQHVARAVAAIAQDQLPFSTGEVINVDGGFHLRIL